MASSIAAKTIFFVATILISIVVINVFTHSIFESTKSLESQSDLQSYRFKSRLQIESVSYNNVFNQVVIFIKNTGMMKINPKYVNLYLDGKKVDRCSNFSINITDDSNLIDKEYFNPSEVLRIVFEEQLDTGSHRLRVTEKYGNKDDFNDLLENTSLSYDIVTPSWCP